MAHGLSNQKNDYTLLLDEVSSTVMYVGEANTGSSTSNNAWKIKKIEGSTDISVKWAEGNSNEDKIWDNRASYIYS
jgi:hypothetical protein